MAVVLAMLWNFDAAYGEPDATPGKGFFQVNYEKGAGAGQTADPGADLGAGAGSNEPGVWRYEPVCSLGGDAVCVSRAQCEGDGELVAAYFRPTNGIEEFRGNFCRGGKDAAGPAARPQITNVMVLRALRRVEVPAAQLIVQPPGGKTLVNFETILHTEADQFTRTVTLLGQRVDLEITPSSFTWRHGDSTSQTTADPGVAFDRGRPMSDYVTHSYDDAHVTVRPSVDTTYSARFRVDGAEWRQVVGTVTIDGQPVDLHVVEGRPALVDAY
ncbi:MAG: hypothetical protein L0H93_03410 [Nocardioides sp.]|nr:hypothetical protein [Nocardioides sp.]